LSGAADVRVAVVSPFVDRQHGTERALAELLDRLAAQHGDTIDLYAQKVTDLICNFSSANSADNSAKIIWRRVRTFPGPHLMQFFGWFLLNRWHRWRSETASGIKSEVIFSPGINAADADVILVHVVFHRVAELQQSRRARGLVALHRKLYYALLCALERRIYRNSRVTLAAVSRHTAAQLARYFDRHDVTVIPNGVNVIYFSPETVSIQREQYRQQWNVSPQDLVLLLIGNDWRNKGLQTLLQACSQCKDLSLRLLVVGQDEQQPFHAEAEKLGIAARVQFFSPVPDVRIFYSAADILVAPSLEDSFNLPVLEAMSCGLPVIVSPAAGVSDWLTNDKDCLVLKDPQNAEELANAIRLLAAHPAQREAIIRSGLQTAKTFSWEAHAGELRKLLVKAAAEKLRRQ
jgi:UDP-glucose:(heptosyl)LPS alpha-1,3-glucosyltransferase